MVKSIRWNQAPAFNAKARLAALKDRKAISELRRHVDVQYFQKITHCAE
jgi:hypothetical protein